VRELRIGDPEVQLGVRELRIGDPEVKLGARELRIGDPEAELGDPEVRIGDPEAEFGVRSRGIHERREVCRAREALVLPSLQVRHAMNFNGASLAHRQVPG